MIEIAVVGAVVQTAAAKVVNIAKATVVPEWQKVMLRWSFMLGAGLAIFLGFVLGNQTALAATMWAVHHIPLCSDATPLGVARVLSKLLLIAMFFKQGGILKIFKGYDDLRDQADALQQQYAPRAFGVPPEIPPVKEGS